MADLNTCSLCTIAALFCTSCLVQTVWNRGKKPGPDWNYEPKPKPDSRRTDGTVVSVLRAPRRLFLSPAASCRSLSRRRSTTRSKKAPRCHGIYRGIPSEDLWATPLKKRKQNFAYKVRSRPARSGDLFTVVQFMVCCIQSRTPMVQQLLKLEPLEHLLSSWPTIICWLVCADPTVFAFAFVCDQSYIQNLLS